ncbi:MAG: hypothetical protein KKB21_01470 [Nanoarchaeota archaeon]|nr:hypothetical protein [Nanoarchaeota archaeon]MBU4086225.1 hypothetical protein [Nanoarchaeota archaeon]
MKKIGVLFILAILFLGFISLAIAEEMPDPTAGLRDNTAGIIDEEGIHTENITGTATEYKSKAEERIESINLWIKNNASWLVYVFGMVPELSWTFALNIYCLLLFLVILVLNGIIIRVPVELLMSLGKGTKEKAITISKIVGLAIFIFLLETKFFLNVIVRPAVWLWDKIFTYGWIAIVIFCLVLLVVLVFFPQILTIISKSYDSWKEKRAKKQQDRDRESLHEEVKVAEKFTDTLTGGAGI